jgi:hypothetical protein
MRIFAGLALGVLAVGSSYAQYVISAHSGVVQYVEGAAYVNDTQVDPKFGQFPDIKENQVFRTTEGRAEILLTPGAFLRVAENSSIRMVSNKLTDTRVEVLTGSAMLECDDIQKDNAIMLLYQGNTMIPVKHGLYRVDSEPARFAVFDGEAIVKGQSGQVTLKGGKQTALNGVLMAENFDKKDGDDLYRWSARRSGYLSKANVSSAMGMRNTGYGGYSGSAWQWNSMFGLYTYVPYRGMYYSPFGYGFYSPYTVGNYYYYPGNNYYGGGGGSSTTATSSAYTASHIGSLNGSRSSGSSSGLSMNGSGFPSSGGSGSGGFGGGYGSTGGGGMSGGGGSVGAGLGAGGGAHSGGGSIGGGGGGGRHP